MSLSSFSNGKVLSFFCGLLLVVSPVYISFLSQNGLAHIGIIAGIFFIVCSLFGELPSWISWIQKIGERLWVGIATGTVCILLPLVVPSHGESSFLAFSPMVWAAYMSIVLVGISFETSSLPDRIYHICQSLQIKPYILIPTYVFIAGLLGNILDGVSIVIISSVIILNLLPHKWAVKSLFALLFGGLISNLITVAAEPTNIKFQDTLGKVLNTGHLSFWVTNWPICLLGILFPAIWLSIIMKRSSVSWKKDEAKDIHVFENTPEGRGILDKIMASMSIALLGMGVITHAILENLPGSLDIALWILLLPAGITAVVHLYITNTQKGAIKHIKEQSPTWIRLMVIFSLLWFLQHGLSNTKNVLEIFFTFSPIVKYSLLVLLALASSITDNVAVAAMQGSIIIHNPLSMWQIRLLLVLLTWSGGLTPFGCLQSLSINHRLKISTGLWLRLTPFWAGLSIAGGLVGLLVSTVLYR